MPYLPGLCRLCLALSCLVAGGLVSSPPSAGADPPADASSSPPDSNLPANNLPVYQRIDQVVHHAAVGPLAARSSAAEFVRRIYLDLTGAIPTAEETEQFILDSAADKRTQLIDRLLQTPAFNRHFAQVWSAMLLERRTEKYVDASAWERYLIDALSRRQPLDQMFRDLLYPDRLPAAASAARKFLLTRDAEPHAMTRDVGRLLLGMDLQCAQCHDHPLIADYYQADYYGLYAFLLRTQLFEDPADKSGKLAELALGEASFESVFTGEGSPVAWPRLPRGTSLITEPVFAEAEAYEVKPDKTAAAVPRYSRRQALADHLADNPQFRRNLANRVWASLMGRGLVHPLDFHFADNPPSNPRLLELLSDTLADNNFDLRFLVRQIALSETYQRSSAPPSPETVNTNDVAARQMLLTSQLEQAARPAERLEQAAGLAQDAWRSAREQYHQLATQLAELDKQLAAAQQESAAAETALAESAAQLSQDQSRAQSVGSALAATQAALTQFSEEAALRDAVQLLAPRAEVLTAAVRSAEQLRDQRAAAAQAASSAAQQLATQREQLLQERLSAEQLAQLEQAATTAQLVAAEAADEIRFLKRQLQLCQALLEYPPLAQHDAQQAAVAWAAIVDLWTVAGQVAPLKPLTPEQLAASGMQATGRLAQALQAAQAAIDKKPAEEIAAADLPAEEQQRLRSVAVQTQLLADLRTATNLFVAQFGGLPGEEFQATVNQALFVGNGPTVSSWLDVSDASWIGKLATAAGDARLIDQVMMSVLSRPATAEEQQQLSAFLAPSESDAAMSRGQAVAEIAWALLASTEFRFNH